MNMLEWIPAAYAWLKANAWPILCALLASTTLRSTARALIDAIAKWAATTPSTDDDAFVAKWGGRIDMVLAVLELIRRVPFGIVVGPLPRTQPIASVRQPRPSMRPLSGAPPAPAPVTTLRPWPTVPTIPTEPIITPVPPRPDKEGPTS